MNSRLSFLTGALIFLLASFLLAAPVLAQMPEAAPSTTRALRLDDAVKAAAANNRTIRVAQMEREKALDQVQVARTYRLPTFSLIALGSQSLTRLGLTLDKGSLGVYPNVGPIPRKDDHTRKSSASWRYLLRKRRAAAVPTIQDRIGNSTGASRRGVG